MKIGNCPEDSFLWPFGHKEAADDCNIKMGGETIFPFPSLASSPWHVGRFVQNGGYLAETMVVCIILYYLHLQQNKILLKLDKMMVFQECTIKIVSEEKLTHLSPYWNMGTQLFFSSCDIYINKLNVLIKHNLHSLSAEIHPNFLHFLE